MTEPPRQFTLALRCPAGTQDAERRLAMLLKYAARVHRFKCLMAYAEPAGPSPDLCLRAKEKADEYGM